ncbi:MAG: hypothetical protein K0R18_574 [Bacillales bacterium]|jgi:hypothetical protein|nr:hypothetical protein [Bacillales bacterium]
MQPLNRDGISTESVMKALHSPHIRLSFRYELLNKNLQRIGDLQTVKSGEISHNALATIKRTAKFSLVDYGDIDYLNDRIKPYVKLWVQNKWVEFPQGVFLLSTPTRKDKTGKPERDIDAFDGLLVLTNDKFEQRYVIQEGTSYYDALIDILLSAGITQYNIEFTDKMLTRSIEYKAGKEKLYAINDLLGQLNFTPLHVDVNGVYTSSTYRSPAIQSIDYTYKDDELSVTFRGMEEELDLFSIPNKWVVVCSNAEAEPLYSVYTNDNPTSPTSTISRGRNIVDFREVSDIADQQALDGYVQRIAFEASQVYGKVTFETALMPMHDYADVLEIDYSPLGIKGKYSETSWTMPLSIGGRMKHEVRRVVSV